MQKIAKKSPSGHHPTTLSGFIFATKACIDNRENNLLSSNISSTCPRNMVNFGPLLSRLGSVTVRHSSSGRQPNFAVLNRGRHIYSTGRPSRWALAHISSYERYVTGVVYVVFKGLILLAGVLIVCASCRQCRVGK